MFEKLYRKIFPLLNFVPPELAHNLAIKFIANYKKEMRKDSSILNTEVCNLKFSNPIGLAAGFDKNGEACDGLVSLGFGFIEVGTITLNPQSGNKKPRIFRLMEDKAIINRLGFNNIGSKRILDNLKKYDFRKKNGIIGANLGKNFDSKELFNDYLNLLKIFDKKTNYITLNVSSPNTPGLRELEKKDNFDKLVNKVSNLKKQKKINVPVFIKLDPDLSKKETSDIAEIILKSKIDGIIISNTSINRSNKLISKFSKESGGISGLPIKSKSNRLLKEFYSLTKGKIPLIGVGGISNGQDAYERILSGASLIQLYTSLVFNGPIVINKIKNELIYLLKKDNYKSIRHAVGKLNK